MRKPHHSKYGEINNRTLKLVVASPPFNVV